MNYDEGIIPMKLPPKSRIKIKRQSKKNKTNHSETYFKPLLSQYPYIFSKSNHYPDFYQYRLLFCAFEFYISGILHYMFYVLFLFLFYLLQEFTQFQY